MSHHHQIAQDPVTDPGAWRAVMTWPLDEGAYGCHLVATWGCGEGIVWRIIEGASPHPLRTNVRTRRVLGEPPLSCTYQRTPGGGLASLSWTPCLRTLELGAEHFSFVGRRGRVVWPMFADPDSGSLNR